MNIPSLTLSPLRRIKQGFFWYLDYVYVLRMRLINVFARKPGNTYRNPGQRAVLIIPGIYEPWHFMRPIARVLHDHSYDVHLVHTLGYNVGTIEAMAKKIDTYIDENNLTDVTILAHSKGGLIGKYLLKSTMSRATIKQLVAINTPFSGSVYAYAFVLPSIRVFTPTSKTLVALGLDTVNNARIVSMYSQFDPHIPKGSHLNGAQNIQLKTYGHFRVLGSTETHDRLLAVLRRSDS